MDSLINSIRKISVNKASVDDLVDSLNKFSVLGKRKAEVEYNEFSVNFKKLLKLNSFLNEMCYSEQLELVPKIKEFLDVLDRKTQYYLQEINWECDPEILEEAQDIAALFFSSLNCNDPFERLKFVLEAYTKIQIILDDLGNK
jgi:hypothetical protein